MNNSDIINPNLTVNFLITSKFEATSNQFVKPKSTVKMDQKPKKAKSCIPISILKERLQRKIFRDKKIIAERQSLDSLFSLNSNIYDLLDSPEYNPSYDARRICHLSEKVTKNLLRLQDSTEGNLLRRKKELDTEQHKKSKIKDKLNRENVAGKKQKEEKLSKGLNQNVRVSKTISNNISDFSFLLGLNRTSFGEHIFPVFDFICKGILFLLMLLYVTNHIPCPICNA